MIQIIGPMGRKKTRIINGFEHIAYEHETYPEEEMIRRSGSYYDWLNKRRSVREFSDKAVPKQVIENLIMSASTAPSGANKQPWVFCAVSNQELKSKIREAAEAEEKASYESRMSERWKKDLARLGTDMHKPFIVTAPWVVIVFKKVYVLIRMAANTLITMSMNQWVLPVVCLFLLFKMQV